MDNNMELKTATTTNSLYKNKNFILLFLGKLVSQVGDVIYNMAIGWYILTITQSAIQMSFYMAFGTIVYVLCGPFGGVIADRLNRKWLMVWMDIIRGATVAIIGFIMFLGFESIWFLYIASFILSICGAIFVPSSNALVPNIVEDEHLTKANSMAGSVNSISNIVGLVAGGALYALVGIKVIFILNAVSYILSGISEIFINYKNNIAFDEKEKRHFIRELIDTYKYIKSERGLFIIIWLGTLINFIIVPLFAVFMPYIYNQILKTSALEYSYVGSAESIGFIIGAIIISAIPQRDKINGYLKMGMVAFSLLIFNIYVFINFYTKGMIPTKGIIISFTVISLLLGTFSSIINIPLGVLMQRKIPNELLGKASSLLNTLVMAAMPIGMVVGGTLADLFPINILILCIAIVISIVTLYIFFQRDVAQV